MIFVSQNLHQKGAKFPVVKETLLFSVPTWLLLSQPQTSTYLNSSFSNLRYTLYLPPKILLKYRLQFLVGWLWYPQEIKTIGYEKVRVVVGGGGWQTKYIMGDVQMASIQRLMYRAHVLTWPAAIQIYCNKRKRLDRKKEFNLHRTGLGHQNRSSLWTGSLFGERVKKSKGEGREKVRACRHTFGTAILPSGPCNCWSSVSKIVICHLNPLGCYQFHM